METFSISEPDLRNLIKEAVITALSERRDLLEEAVTEAILDLGLARAMEEGDTGDYAEEASILEKLKS